MKNCKQNKTINITSISFHKKVGLYLAHNNCVESYPRTVYTIHFSAES